MTIEERVLAFIASPDPAGFDDLALAVHAHQLATNAAFKTWCDAAGGAPQVRWSIEGAAGVQLDYTGTIQSVAIGFAPSRRLTFLIGAERSRTDDEIECYPA